MESEEIYDDYGDEEYEDDLDGIGGECALTIEGGVYTCGMVGSEECEFECYNHHMIGKRTRKS